MYRKDQSGNLVYWEELLDRLEKLEHQQAFTEVLDWLGHEKRDMCAAVVNPEEAHAYTANQLFFQLGAAAAFDFALNSLNSLRDEAARRRRSALKKGGSDA